MDGLILLAGGVLGATALLHILSVAMVALRFQYAGSPVVASGAAAVTILRPVCGIENFIEETLRSTFHLDHPHYEVLFCAAHPRDEVIPLVRRLIAEHPDVDARLLVGNTEISTNPKLNNLVKGWHAARHDWILMVDSNVLMPANHIQRMLSAWHADTGLVCSPPVGCAAGNLWAELECAFLNSYQARWQCFADSVGLGFAQGKAMLWRRGLVERAGGIEALASEVAEDAAATKLVRGLGLRVRLVTEPFLQPLGHRGFAAVWRRQVRWARLRRDTFKLFFIPELFAGAVPAMFAAAAVAMAAGWSVVATVVPVAIAWYAAEAMLSAVAGWSFSMRSILVWMLRDALLPVLWVAAWAGDDFEWRGNAMSVADPAVPRERHSNAT